MTKEIKDQILLALDLVEFTKRSGFNAKDWPMWEVNRAHLALLNVDPDEVRKALGPISERKPRKSYQLTIAVGKSNKCVVLEDFPKDEKHEGLHDYVADFEDNSEVMVDPGIYLADVVLVKEPDGAFLEVIRTVKMR